MCVCEYTYRGLKIYKNINKDFNTYYWSIANPHIHPKDNPNKDAHTHVTSLKRAYKVIDCYHLLRKGKYKSIEKYPVPIRNKAMRLLGIAIHEKH